MSAKIPMVSGVPVAIPPPKGYQVDFENPPRNADKAFYWVTAVGLVIAHLFLFQNLYVKCILRRKVDLELIFVLLTWITAVVVIGILIYMNANKIIGVHIWEMPLTTFAQFAKLFFITPVLFCPLVAFAKVALALFYRALSIDRAWRWCVDLIIAFVVGYNTAILFALIFACSPTASSWDISITNKECVNQPSIYVAQVAMGTISDIILFVAPIPMIMKLRISKAQKLGVLGIFAIGLITVVTGVVRIALLVMPDFSGTDTTWVSAPVIIVAIAEICLLIVCATLPTLKGFFKHVAPSVFGDLSTRGYKRTYDMSNDGGYRRTGATGGGRSAYGRGTNKAALSSHETERGDVESDGYDMNVLGSPHQGRTTIVERASPAPTTHHRTGPSLGSLGGNRTWDARPVVTENDAIMQTRTITVTYDDESLRRGGGSSGDVAGSGGPGLAR